jgi:hypothetical protein
MEQNMKIKPKYVVGQKLYQLYKKLKKVRCECCGQLIPQKAIEWFVDDSLYILEVASDEDNNRGFIYTITDSDNLDDWYCEDEYNIEVCYFLTRESAQAECDRRNSELKERNESNE